LIGSLAEFFRVATGGILLGLFLGWVISKLISRIDDYLIEITLTTVLAYGSYLLAEQLHFSGVLAVVAAGLITGRIGPQGMSPTTRIVLYNFWEYITFLVNSMVFLLIGLEVDLHAFAASWQAILWAIGAVLLARFIVVYGLSWITGHYSEPISRRWRHVLFWGGLRGALSLALVLSLPAAFGPERDLLQTMAFGVALFTLLVQATSMNTLVRKLGIVTIDPMKVDYDMRHARLNALRSAENHMERRYREGLISAPAWERLKPKLQEQTALLADSVRELLRVEPVLEAEELDTQRREILRAQRAAYMGMRSDGIISEDVFEKLSVEADVALEEGGGPFWFLPQESLPQRLKDGLEGTAQVEEIRIQLGAVCEAQQVMDMPWPKHFVIASLRRGTEIMIPKGDTILLAGDVLTVVGESETIHAARLLCE
jgi:CPA1 family monovalent cation:H+ antiporter